MASILAASFLLFLRSSLGSLNNTNLAISIIEAVPFNFVDPATQEMGGICIDILRRVKQLAQDDGVYFDYELKVWQGTYTEAVADVVDSSTATALVASDVSVTRARLEMGAIYTLPIADDGVLVVKSALKPQTGLTTIGEIQAAKNAGKGSWGVCIRRGTTQSKHYSQKYPDVLWIPVDNNEQAYKSLQNQDCEIAILGAVQTNMRHLVTNGANILVTTHGAQMFTQFLAWPAKNPSIAHEFNKYLAALQSSGEIGVIKDKYFAQTKVATTGKPLVGRHYYVVVVPDAPYLQLNKNGLEWPDKKGTGLDAVQPQPANLTGHFSGFVVDVLTDLGEKLGFEFTFILPSNAHAGFDGSYGQAVRDVAELGTKGNFYAGPLFMTSSRLETLKLTAPFQNTGLNLLTKRKAAYSNKNAFAIPFSRQLWLLIVGLVVAAGVVFWYLESDEGNHSDDIVGEYGRTLMGLHENFIHTTYMSMVTITTFACHTPSTVGGKVFSFFYLLFCTLILTSYTANLTTIMVGLNMASKIPDTGEFVKGGNTACIQSDTAYGKHLKETYTKFGLKFVEKPTKEEMLVDLKAGKCNGMINSEWMVIHQHNAECGDFSRGLEPIWRQSFAFGATPDARGEEVAQYLSEEITRMRSAEVLDELTNKWFDPSKCELAGEESESDVSKMTMGVEHLRLPLIYFGFFTIAAWAVEKLVMLYIQTVTKRALNKTHEDGTKCITDGLTSKRKGVSPVPAKSSLDFAKFWDIIDSDKDGVARRWKLKIHLAEAFGQMGIKISKVNMGKLLTKLDNEKSGLISKEHVFETLAAKADDKEAHAVSKSQLEEALHNLRYCSCSCGSGKKKRCAAATSVSESTSGPAISPSKIAA